MFCKNCGEKIPDGAKFCANCGGGTENQVTPPVGQYTQPAPAKKSSGVGIVIGILVGAMAFLALLVVGLFLIFSLLAKSSIETPPEPIDDPDPIVEPTDIDVTFGSYSITLPYDTDYETSDDGVTFEIDGYYYEFAIIKQSYSIYKNNVNALIGQEDESTGMVINNAEVVTYNNIEYVLLRGLYNSKDYTMALAKSDLIPSYTIAVAKYGKESSENETLKMAEELIKSLKHIEVNQ